MVGTVLICSGIFALCLAMLAQSGYSAPGNTTMTTVETTRNSSSTTPLMTSSTNESTTMFGDLNNNEAPSSTPLPADVSPSVNQTTSNVNSTATSRLGTTPTPQSTTTTTSTTRRPANQTYDTKIAPANVTAPQFDHAVETTVDHPKNINAEPLSLNNTAKARGLNSKKPNETRIVNEKARIAFKKGTVVFFSGMCGPQGCMVGETADEVLVPVVEVARSKY